MALTTTPDKNTQQLPRTHTGDRVTAAMFNRLVDAINQLRQGVPAARQMRKAVGGGGAGFDWGVLREVDAESKTMKAQRVRYGTEEPDSEEPHDPNSGCYRKLVAYGEVVEVFPPPGMTYQMFACEDAIRPVDEIPPEGEDLGWTVPTIKIYKDMTIEFLDKFDASVVPVDPNDETVSA